VASVALVEEQRVEVGGTLQSFVVLSDGTVWTLLGDEMSMWLERYTATGELAARGPTLPLPALRDFTTQDLGADDSGNAWVVTYTQVAGATADDDFSEDVTLHRFGTDGAPVGDPLELFGLANSLVVAGPAGAVTIAGNGAENAHRGSLVRLAESGEAEWIQSGVSTDGHGVSAGVAGLVVHADGSSSIVSELSRTGSGAVYGVSRFGADGTPGGMWHLPTTLVSGYSAGIAASPAQDLAVSGMLTDSEGVVEYFPAAGGFAWAFSMQAGYAPAVVIDPDSGRVFAGVANGIAVIEPGSATCGVTMLPPARLWASIPPGSLRFAAGGLYFADQAGFTRFAVSSR
jgi:hypothetical protein